MADRRSTRDPNRVRLQPADAFDLIRWLARSQSDPRKAVAELVQNAIDANARTIAIERRRRGRRPVLVVRDDGEGIDPQSISRIFEPFYTADDAQGSGLGLAIASELAERMSGRLTVVSMPGDTAFTLELPNDEAPPGGVTSRPPSSPPVHQRA